MTKPIPRIRKQKARRRAQDAAATAPTGAPADPNAVEIVPASAAEREERKQKLRAELQEQKQSESKMSGKKRKRLDKYIDTKLKKEENLELIKKLASQKVDTSMFKSSKKLGRGDESKRERLGRILRERNAGIGTVDEEEDLWERPREEEEHSGLSEDDTRPQSVAAPRQDEALQKPLAFGSGLKRPLDLDDSGNPLIQRRKRTKRQLPVSKSRPTPDESEDQDGSVWEGFDTESEDGGVAIGSSSDEDSSLAIDEETLENEFERSDSQQSEDEADDETTSETSMDEKDETSDDEDIVEDREIKKARLQERSSAFKAWASEQRNVAVGFTPSTNIDLFQSSKSVAALETGPTFNKDNQSSSKIDSDPRIHDRQASTAIRPPAAIFQEMTSKRNVFNVPVERTSEIEDARLALPVVAEEQKIMEAIHNHDIVILWGATGSGKTTQIPQFLYESGYGSAEGPTPGLIGITQPRRVAAVSMAKRVAVEMGAQGNRVSYQIRFDSTVSNKTAVKFMTDGVLIREIAQDFTLSKYSAVVIDEAHERSVNTDILIGMLSRIVETRAELASKTKTYKPLKLVIMSATLRTADLTQNKSLFRKAVPPVIQAEGRQYPVTVHFARRTQRDYLEETFQKVSRGHRKLPQGAILVFLTGQNEINNLSKRLKQAFSATENSGHGDWLVRTSAADASIEDDDIELTKINGDRNDEDSDSDAEIRGLDNDDEENEFSIGDDPEEELKVHVLPLYSQLPTDQQMRIFEPPPEGSRLIVLATNVAETSLTIPNVRYVFDCGRSKEKHYDKTSGVQSFDVGWISKASASQRAGRAGRTGSGHCYRLYSSAVFERDFAEFAEPEITRTPIEGVVLQLKSMGIPNVANFPFPTPPERSSLVKAEQLLEYLGAIVKGKVTELGRELALYPLSPRLSRILCMAQNHGIISHAIALVAVLAVADVFIPESQLDIQEQKPATEVEPWTEADNQEALRRENKRKEYNTFHGHLSRLDRSSDALKLLTTVTEYAQSSKSFDPASQDLFRTYTRVKALQEALQLRHQLSSIVSTHKPGSTSSNRHETLPEPTHKQAKILNQLIAAGYIDQIAIRSDLSSNPPPSTSRKPKRATDVPYTTLFPSWTAADAQRLATAQYDTDRAKADAEARLKSVYIHPSSVLAHTSPASLPQYLIYSHISRAAPRTAAATSVAKTRIHPLAPISPAQIIALAAGTPLLEDGKPVGKIETMERDAAGRERRRVTCVPFLRAGRDSGGGGNEWPIPPARKAVQRRERGAGWVVDAGEA